MFSISPISILIRTSFSTHRLWVTLIPNTTASSRRITHLHKRNAPPVQAGHFSYGLHTGIASGNGAERQEPHQLRWTTDFLPRLSVCWYLGKWGLVLCRFRSGPPFICSAGRNFQAWARSTEVPVRGRGKLKWHCQTPESAGVQTHRSGS